MRDPVADDGFSIAAFVDEVCNELGGTWRRDLDEDKEWWAQIINDDGLRLDFFDGDWSRVKSEHGRIWINSVVPHDLRSSIRLPFRQGKWVAKTSTPPEVADTVRLRVLTRYLDDVQKAREEAKHVEEQRGFRA